MLFIPPFNVLSSDFYVSLSLVVAATVSLIKNFAKIRDTGSLCVIPSVSIFASVYITEVDIIIFVCIFFFYFSGCASLQDITSSLVMRPATSHL